MPRSRHGSASILDRSCEEAGDPMRGLVPALLALLCLSVPAAAQIDFRSPRAAGRVWENKIIENNRQARDQGAEADAADAAWEKPLAPADMQATLMHNRAEYERRVKRFGKGHADRWLDRLARTERFERGRSAAKTPPATETGNGRVR